MSIGLGLLWFSLAAACFLGIVLVILTGDSLEGLEDEDQRAEAFAGPGLEPSTVAGITTREAAQ